jgi:hypothetical protein
MGRTRAVLILWHAILRTSSGLLGQFDVFPLFISFLLGGFHFFFL